MRLEPPMSDSVQDWTITETSENPPISAARLTAGQLAYCATARRSGTAFSKSSIGSWRCRSYLALACVIDRPGYNSRYRERYGSNT